MKKTKKYKRLVIFFVATFMCLISVGIVSAIPFTGTPSPFLNPVFGRLIDFDDKPTGTPIGHFDYLFQGVDWIGEIEGLGTFARYPSSQSMPNYIGTGPSGERGTDANMGWDGTIMIKLHRPTNMIGIGVANSGGGPEVLTIYGCRSNLLETQIVPTGTNVYCGFVRNTCDIAILKIKGDFFAIDDLQFNVNPLGIR